MNEEDFYLQFFLLVKNWPFGELDQYNFWRLTKLADRLAKTDNMSERLLFLKEVKKLGIVVKEADSRIAYAAHRDLDKMLELD